VIVGLAAVGPQRVWAEVQRLLGYVPGIDFVDLKETQVLTTAVEVTRDGVTLRVGQMLAQPGRRLPRHAGVAASAAGPNDIAFVMRANRYWKTIQALTERPRLLLYV